MGLLMAHIFLEREPPRSMGLKQVAGGGAAVDKLVFMVHQHLCMTFLLSCVGFRYRFLFAV